MGIASEPPLWWDHVWNITFILGITYTTLHFKVNIDRAESTQREAHVWFSSMENISSEEQLTEWRLLNLEKIQFRKELESQN